MREFDEFEKKIIREISDTYYLEQYFETKKMLLSEIIDKQFLFVAIDWNSSSTVKFIYKSIHKASMDKDQIHFFSFVALIKYLEDNRLLLVCPITLDGQSDRCYYNHTRYLKNETNKDQYSWNSSTSLFNLIPTMSDEWYINLNNELERYTNSIVIPTYALVDLVKSNFKTIEKKNLEAAWVAIFVAFCIGGISIFLGLLSICISII